MRPRKPISPVVELVADLILIVIAAISIYFAVTTTNIWLGMLAGWAFRSVFA